MRKKQLILPILSLLLVHACETAPMNLSDSPTEDAASQMINYDALIDSASRLTTSTGFEYTAEQLAAMEDEQWRHNVEDVIRDVAVNELGIEIAFMQSMPATYNPRKVLVGSTSGSLYRVELVKRHNQGGIWTAESYSVVEEENKPVIYERIEYRTVTMEEVDEVIQAWAQLHLDNEDGAEEVYSPQDAAKDGDKQYILLVAKPEESIELLDVLAADLIINVSYANAFPNVDRFGRQPYILLEFDSPAMDIVIHRHSSVQVTVTRPYM